MTDKNRPVADSPSAMSGKCPVMHGGNTTVGTSNRDWWPKALNLDIHGERQVQRHAQRSPRPDR